MAPRKRRRSSVSVKELDARPQLKANTKVAVPRKTTPPPPTTTTTNATTTAAATAVAGQQKLERKLAAAEGHLQLCTDANKRRKITQSMERLRNQLGSTSSIGAAAASPATRKEAKQDKRSRKAKKTAVISAPACGAVQSPPTPSFMAAALGISEVEAAARAKRRRSRFDGETGDDFGSGSPTKRWLWHDQANAASSLPTALSTSSSRSTNVNWPYLGSYEQQKPTGIQEQVEQESPRLHLVGTCMVLEKAYARVPAGMIPNPETVRPAPVLARALKLVMKRWRRWQHATTDGGGSDDVAVTESAAVAVAPDKQSEQELTWVKSQLRAIRQDLTVQDLGGTALGRRVYKCCVRVALEAGDWAEFAASLARLFELCVGESISPPAEFAAYRLLATIAEGVAQQQQRKQGWPAQQQQAEWAQGNPFGNKTGTVATAGGGRPALVEQCRALTPSLRRAPPVAHALQLASALVSGQWLLACRLAAPSVVQAHGSACRLVALKIGAVVQKTVEEMRDRAVRTPAQAASAVAAAREKRRQKGQVGQAAGGKPLVLDTSRSVPSSMAAPTKQTIKKKKEKKKKEKKKKKKALS